MEQPSVQVESHLKFFLMPLNYLMFIRVLKSKVNNIRIYLLLVGNVTNDENE